MTDIFYQNIKILTGSKDIYHTYSQYQFKLHKILTLLLLHMTTGLALLLAIPIFIRKNCCRLRFWHWESHKKSSHKIFQRGKVLYHLYIIFPLYPLNLPYKHFYPLKEETSSPQLISSLTCGGLNTRTSVGQTRALLTVYFISRGSHKSLLLCHSLI